MPPIAYGLFSAFAGLVGFSSFATVGPIGQVTGHDQQKNALIFLG
jgi:hypothetical protein